MNEDLCKNCGERMQFVGSLLSGGLKCEHCDKAETISITLEQARLKEEEEDWQDLLPLRQPTPEEVDENIKRLNRLGRMRSILGAYYRAVTVSASQHQASLGELCLKCGGQRIQHVGCNPDGMATNHAYNCRDCGHQWEGY